MIITTSFTLQHLKIKKTTYQSLLPVFLQGCILAKETDTKKTIIAIASHKLLKIQDYFSVVSCEGIFLIPAFILKAGHHPAYQLRQILQI
jgi:hypothetical protein